MTTPHALLYRSLATRPMADLELRALGARAAQRNARQGITGLLLHGQLEHVTGLPGAFVQWLEGPEDAVRDLFESIREDARHDEIEVVAEGPVAELSERAERLFPEWSMETEVISELPATLPGFLRYVRERRAEGEGRWALAA